VTTASDAPAASAAQESQVAALSLVGSTVELSDADLEKLVAELDGMETLPSAEPQSITITDEDFATGDENIDR
jgi:flagellar hook assembly protein FlgD